MLPVRWSLAAAAVLIVLLTVRALSRTSRTRDAVLAEVRRALRDSTIERRGSSGPKVRGQLGELEITVDLHTDPSRPAQSPMWRMLAVGPVALDRAVEARVAGWHGWLDPWLELGETLELSGGVGPSFTLHAECMPSSDHPVIAALRRQGPGLGPGALHARPDLIRAEAKFRGRPEQNRALFAYLHAMAELSELQRVRTPRSQPPRHLPNIRVMPTGGV